MRTSNPPPPPGPSGPLRLRKGCNTKLKLYENQKMHALQLIYKNTYFAGRRVYLSLVAHLQIFDCYDCCLGRARAKYKHVLHLSSGIQTKIYLLFDFFISSYVDG